MKNEIEFKRSKRGVLVKDFREQIFESESEKQEAMKCVVPCYCPVCKTLMKDSFDSEYFQKKGACYSCCVYFAPEISEGVYNFKFGPFPQKEDVKASLRWRERKYMLMAEEKKRIIEKSGMGKKR